MDNAHRFQEEQKKTKWNEMKRNEMKKVRI